MGGDRRGTNYVQGLTNVADFTGAAAVGIGNHVELFGAFLFDTRINRNAPPVFVDEARQGGIVARFPRVNESWTGNNVGDLYLGTKGWWSACSHNLYPGRPCTGPPGGTRK